MIGALITRGLGYSVKYLITLGLDIGEVELVAVPTIARVHDVPREIRAISVVPESRHISIDRENRGVEP